MPVIATDVSAEKRASAPSAIAAATCGDTAPNSAIRAGSTPSRSDFASFEYETTPPATYSDDPGRSVSRAAMRPPEHDSASPIQRPRNNAATWSSIDDPSTEKSVPRCRSATASRAADWAPEFPPPHLVEVHALAGVNGVPEPPAALPRAPPQARRDLEPR